MLNKIIFLIFIFYLSLEANPYKKLNSDIKLTLMVNYFLNEELKTKIPPKPIKEKLEDDGLNLDPIKYEKYFNYIQRLKAIHDSRAEAQQNINDKYEGKIGFYNAKLKLLKKFYSKNENLNPILQNSINKAFIVIYGKPTFRNLTYLKTKHIINGTLFIKNIYNIDNFGDKEIKIFDLKDEKDNFLKYHNKSKIKVQFDYKNDILSLKNILFLFNSKWYNAIFVNKPNINFKLKIKINNDIFKLIKLEDKK
jgi:hypothetical protein